MSDRIKRMSTLGETIKSVDGSFSNLLDDLADEQHAEQERPQATPEPTPGVTVTVNPLKPGKVADRVTFLEDQYIRQEKDICLLVNQVTQLHQMLSDVTKELNELRKAGIDQQVGELKSQVSSVSSSYVPPSVPTTPAPASVVSGSSGVSVASSTVSASTRWHKTLKATTTMDINNVAQLLSTAYARTGRAIAVQDIKPAVNEHVLAYFKQLKTQPNVSVTNVLDHFRDLTKNQ